MAEALPKLFIQKRFQEAESLSKSLLSGSLTNETAQLVLLFRLRNAHELGTSKQVWEETLSAWGGLEHLPDAFAVVGLQSHVKRGDFTEARATCEAWLATQPDSYFDQISMGMEPATSNYERLLELYLLHVLPKLSPFSEIQEFLNYNYLLKEETKKNYNIILDRLKGDAQKLNSKGAISSVAGETSVVGNAFEPSKKASQTDKTSTTKGSTALESRSTHLKPPANNPQEKQKPKNGLTSKLSETDPSPPVPKTIFQLYPTRSISFGFAFTVLIALVLQRNRSLRERIKSIARTALQKIYKTLEMALNMQPM
ncbi:hypothetical protein BC829DRAFT_6938 [Chytridium lagenaria]|nr:hypothetical protein BC829DRAFT_6938 [Chytridium lagenaria]